MCKAKNAAKKSCLDFCKIIFSLKIRFYTGMFYCQILSKLFLKFRMHQIEIRNFFSFLKCSQKSSDRCCLLVQLRIFTLFDYYNGTIPQKLQCCDFFLISSVKFLNDELGKKSSILKNIIQNRKLKSKMSGLRKVIITTKTQNHKTTLKTIY